MQPSEMYPRPSEPSSAHTPVNGKARLDKAARLPEGTKIKMPLDIVLSLLRPDELTKLQKYIASYLGKHLHR